MPDLLANLPTLFISVRQPWAWLIVNTWKNGENRNWYTPVRGRVGIHAAKTCTVQEWEECRFFVAGMSSRLAALIPDLDELPRGGIVGETNILDCVTRHSSEWFQGPFFFVCDDSNPLPFIPCNGAPLFYRYQQVGDQLVPQWGRNTRSM